MSLRICKLKLNILQSTKEQRQMKEIAAIYAYENSESAIRNITSGMISRSHHKGCSFGQEGRAQTQKWKSLNKSGH